MRTNYLGEETSPQNRGHQRGAHEHQVCWQRPCVTPTGQLLDNTNYDIFTKTTKIEAAPLHKALKTLCS